MAIIFNNKKKKSKASQDHNYGGFWLNRGDADVSMDGRSSASSVVKAIKLNNYQKAIGNFVKILSQRDVPVFFKGSESYTDFDSVVIAGNINEKNFDVTAGLALHEASHLKHTQKEVLTTFMSDYDRLDRQEIKNMLNWIEDRRIDTIVFKSCPGYKGYYHKMYDHYFRNKDIAKMLKSPKYCTPTMENFFAHIINMMNPAFDSRRIVGLTEITKLIDVNNISRLEDTEAALELAKEVVAKINEIIEVAQTQEEEEQPGAGENEEQEEQEEQEDQSGPDSDSSDEEEEEDTEGDGSGGTEGDEGAGEEDGEGNEGPEMQDLTPQEEQKVREALKEAIDQVAGRVAKKDISKSVGKKIVKLQDTEIDYAAVGPYEKKQDCLIYRLDKEVGKLATITKANQTLNDLRQQDKLTTYGSVKETMPEQKDAERLLRQYDGPAGLNGLSYAKGRFKNMTQVNEGLQLGAMLGRKLLTRRESRSLETTRLRSGRIDNKRLAHAGYGIENIFSQIHIEKYKKANIHLTIDASGSMGGSRWMNSIKMAAAIGKAVSMIDGLELQVSMRETDIQVDSPVVSIIYDSRTNRLNHLTNLLNIYDCNSMTPEGLCLEAMLKKNLLIPSTEELDSYLINICDGAPGCGNYGGRSALNHTRKQVKRINNELGIKHVGFFFGDDKGRGFEQFKAMYGGKESKALPDASNATAIATHMNKELMNK